MTTQLPERERPQTAIAPAAPEVLFEEAHRRRRRRWQAGGLLSAAAAIAAGLIIGIGGGGGGGDSGAGGRGSGHGQPSGSASGVGSSHTANPVLGSAPVTQSYSTSPEPVCPLAPRSRYLPAWTGCVSSTFADLTGGGRRDLVLTYSLLEHQALDDLPPRTLGAKKRAVLYPTRQGLLRVIAPGGRTVTVTLYYTLPQARNRPRLIAFPPASALIAAAHVSDLPGRQILLDVGHLSSGSTAMIYSLYRGRLIDSGVELAYGGDGGTRASFQCVAGSPARLIQHQYELVRLIHEPLYGLWRETTTTYAWHGPRLAQAAVKTVERRVSPRDGIGSGCTAGVA